MTKTKKNLEKSLANSRQSSPNCSPKVNKKGKKKKVEDTRKVQRKSTKENRSEYNNVLDSMLKLKQGSSNYADIVANAISATDNIFTLTEEQAQAQFSPVKEATKVKQSRSSKQYNDVDAMLGVIDKFANHNRLGKRERKSLAGELLNAFTEQTVKGNNPTTTIDTGHSKHFRGQ